MVDSARSVLIDGRSLTLDQVVAVARDDAAVGLAAESIGRMRRSREVLVRAAAAGESIYGATTGVGALKRVALEPGTIAAFNRSMVLSSRVGQGPLADREVVRATLLRLANAFARGVAGVRPELAQLVVRALNEDWPLSVRTLGSVGQADLAPLADLTIDLVDRARFALDAGEGLAMIDNNSFSTAIAALAIRDLTQLAEWLDAAGALDLEAFQANMSVLHPVLRERPYPGLQQVADRLRTLLAGSSLWRPGAARNLQDPLTYRCLPQINGALRDALTFASGQLEIELNAAQNNPLVDLEDESIASVGCFEVLPLASALDFVRIALAPVLTSASERAMKLLHAGFSGLPPGLASDPDRADDGYTEFGVVGQSLAAEARLLAAPVSFEVVSSSQAEGIEDRMTMAALAGRRLADMVELGRGVAAIELVVAARAVDLRPGHTLGGGTAALHRIVRDHVPSTASGEPPPGDLRPLTEFLRGSDVARLADRSPEVA